jgi:hypothetical protein
MSEEALRAVHNETNAFETRLAKRARKVAASRNHETVLEKDVVRAREELNLRGGSSLAFKAAQMGGPILLGVAGDEIVQSISSPSGLSFPYLLVLVVGLIATLYSLWR